MGSRPDAAASKATAWGRRGLVAFAVLSMLLSPTLVTAEPRKQPFDTRALFTPPSGVLSPGYLARHATSTAQAPDFVDNRDSFPVFALTFNPALAPFGKIGGRAQIAPFRAHAFFLEVSRLSFPIPGVDNEKASLTEIDVGYHLFPMEDGLRGLYIGPRYMHASGSTDQYVVSAYGIGGDVGYEFVIGPLALDFGIGGAYAKGSSDPSAAVEAQINQLGAQASSVSTHQEAVRVVPIATAAIGLAFLVGAQTFSRSARADSSVI